MDRLPNFRNNDIVIENYLCYLELGGYIDLTIFSKKRKVNGEIDKDIPSRKAVMDITSY